MRFRTTNNQRRLDLYHNPVWFLDELLDADQECDCLSSIYNAVIVGQGHIHHWPHYNLTVYHYRAALDFVHAQNTALRNI